MLFCKNQKITIKKNDLFSENMQIIVQFFNLCLMISSVLATYDNGAEFRSMSKRATLVTSLLNRQYNRMVT